MPDSDTKDADTIDAETAETGDPQVGGPVVGGLCGSLRGGSHTRMAVQLALEGAAETGADTRLIDLRDFELMFCNGEDDADEPADVDRLRAAVTACHGLVIGTPEYHGSFSGVLKNALDLMGFDEMGGKMIGLVGVSGGAMGGLNALSGLRTIGRSMHSWVLPAEATIPKAWQVFDADGNCTDEALAKRVRNVGREVARFAYLHHSKKTQEFVRLWERAPSNPGG